MITNLSELLAKAAIQEPMVKRTGEWVHEDANGNTVTETFQVFIIKDISFSAQEKIYLGDDECPEAGTMSRGISERLRFGENGTEKLTYKQAAELPSSLALALSSVIAAYTAGKVSGDEPAKE